MCSPTWETRIPSDMCSPTWETRIPSDMCSPTWETRIPSDREVGLGVVLEGVGSVLPTC